MLCLFQTAPNPNNIPKSMSSSIVRSLSRRRGVSLVEVMFSVVIVMVGLLGVAALIPVAGRQATDSYVMTVAASEGQNWYRMLLARGLHVPRPNQPWLRADDQVSGRFEQISSTAQLDTFFPVDGFCIDPLFWSYQGIDVNGNVGIWNPGQTCAFRRSLFPYFHTDQSPLNPPFQAGMAVPSWGFQPRLHRVTFPSAWPTGLQPAQTKVVEALFRTLNDPVLIRDEKDQSLNAVRGFFSDSTGTIAQSVAAGNLSWIATLVPMEIDATQRPSSYTLSVVVFHRRESTFSLPSPNSFSMDELPKSERIALVTGLTFPPAAASIGNANHVFSGGNGFSVNLVGWKYGERFVKPGSWIMLSRRLTSPVSSNVRHLHRWYRVATATMPASPPSDSDVDSVTWSEIDGSEGDRMMQRVHLMGPDWIFQARDQGPAIFEPTVATIVPDVVSVYERIIEVK